MTRSADPLNSVHPLSHRAIAKRVRAGGVGGCHSADRAKRRARWTHRKAQTLHADSALNFSADRAGLHDDRLVADLADILPARQIDDHARPNRRAGHAASRTARDERCTFRLGPIEKYDEVLDIDRDRDGGRDYSLDACAFGVDRSRLDVGAEYSAKALNLG